MVSSHGRKTYNVKCHEDQVQKHHTFLLSGQPSLKLLSFKLGQLDYALKLSVVMKTTGMMQKSFFKVGDKGSRGVPGYYGLIILRKV